MTSLRDTILEQSRKDAAYIRSLPKHQRCSLELNGRMFNDA
jgi:hypothetical protein